MPDSFDIKKKVLAKRINYSSAPGKPPIAQATISQLVAEVDGFLAKGQAQIAGHLLVQLLQAVPESIFLKLKLVELYFSVSQYEQALPLLNAVLAADANNAIALEYKAGALFSIGQVEAAIQVAEKAIKVSSPSPFLYSNLGVYYKTIGDFSQAEQAFRNALALDESYIACYRNMMIMPDVEFTQDILDKLMALSEKPDIKPEDKAGALYCISLFYRRHKQVDKEFSNLNQANEIYAKSRVWNEDGYSHLFSKLIEQTSQDFIRFQNKAKALQTVPIFISSMPRSGSTLLEQILSSHPQVASAGEAGFCQYAQKATNAQLLSRQVDYVDWIASPHAQRLFAASHKNLSAIIAEHETSVPYLCEKSIGNDLYLGLCLLGAPQAKVIHCLRNPMDTCLSNYQTFFDQGQAFSYKLEWVARRYQLHIELMDHWKALFPDRILTINYEDLVSQGEKITQDILAFVGLEWADECLNFYQVDNQVRTASNWQVRQPLYNSASGRWRPYEQYLQPVKDVLGISA